MPGKYGLFTVTIPKTTLNITIPKLRHPEAYTETLHIEIGKAFLNVFLQKRKAQFVSKFFLNQVGIYFIRYVNQNISSGCTSDPATFFSPLAEQLTSILHYQSYQDPDNCLETLNMSLFKKNVDRRLNAMFSHTDTLQTYYQIIAILIHGLHLHLPNKNELSLQHWEKAYHLVVQKMETHRVSLQTFFPQMNEVFKVKNIKRMKFIYTVPFTDFKPEVLLQIAKLVKLVDKKYVYQKNQCLYAIQQQLAASKQGIFHLQQLFASLPRPR